MDSPLGLGALEVLSTGRVATCGASDDNLWSDQLGLECSPVVDLTKASDLIFSSLHDSPPLRSSQCNTLRVASYEDPAGFTYSQVSLVAV